MRRHTNRGFEARLELVRPRALEATLRVEDRDRRVALYMLEQRPRLGRVGELAVHFCKDRGANAGILLVRLDVA